MSNRRSSVSRAETMPNDTTIDVAALLPVMCVLLLLLPSNQNVDVLLKPCPCHCCDKMLLRVRSVN